MRPHRAFACAGAILLATALSASAVEVPAAVLRVDRDLPLPTSRLDIPPDDLGFAGAQVATEDNQTTGTFLGMEFTTETRAVPPEEAEAALDALIADTRNSGTSLNTWIDIQQLSVMDESIGKVAYRAIQEGLTNARRHAPGAPVSLEVSATPQAGVHIHISNPIATDATETQRAHGAGLPGLAARVHSVNGQCRYGMDDRHLFHVDVQLPWRS